MSYGLPASYDAWRTAAPPEGEPARCPVCGEECDTLYRRGAVEIVGCDNCIDAVEPWVV